MPSQGPANIGFMVHVCQEMGTSKDQALWVGDRPLTRSTPETTGRGAGERPYLQAGHQRRQNLAAAARGLHPTAMLNCRTDRVPWRGVAAGVGRRARRRPGPSPPGRSDQFRPGASRSSGMPAAGGGRPRRPAAGRPPGRGLSPFPRNTPGTTPRTRRRRRRSGSARAWGPARSAPMCRHGCGERRRAAWAGMSCAPSGRAPSRSR